MYINKWALLWKICSFYLISGPALCSSQTWFNLSANSRHHPKTIHLVSSKKFLLTAPHYYSTGQPALFTTYVSFMHLCVYVCVCASAHVHPCVHVTVRGCSRHQWRSTAVVVESLVLLTLENLLHTQPNINSLQIFKLWNKLKVVRGSTSAVTHSHTHCEMYVITQIL